MNKAILLSVRPEHAVNILNGAKTLELRKRVPKGFVGWVNLYCTKGKPRLSVVQDDENGKTYYYLNSNWGRELNGDVVARFWFDEYDKYVDATNCYMTSCGMQCDNEYMYQLCELQDKLKNTCLTCDEIEAYGKGKDLYAWHIKNLEIFDYPMELSEFYTWNKGDKWTPDMNWLTLTRAPQSWQYVYVKE